MPGARFRPKRPSVAGGTWVIGPVAGAIAGASPAMKLGAPLFAALGSYGDPALAAEEKIAPIAHAEGLLSTLGVHASLAADVARARQALTELSQAILSRAPSRDERSGLEGRGAYHRVEIEGREATVYVKGIGSERCFDGLERAFPGFPADRAKLFFDSPSADHPRLLGTETLSWALLEMINAAVIFARQAERGGWRSLAEALDAGVTVPLEVTHFKELSAKMQALIREALAEEQHPGRREGMSWRGNFVGLGSVAQIVPSARRLDGSLEGVESDAVVGERRSDPAVAQTTGATLRALLEVGYVYSRISSHAQNLYDRGAVAQADNSDLVHLGDVRGPDAADARCALLFAELNPGWLTRRGGLMPSGSPGPGAGWPRTIVAQQAFWGELLKGVAHPDALPVLARMVPLLGSEVSLAASTLLISRADGAAWEATADAKQTLLDSFAALGVAEEYQVKTKTNLRQAGDPKRMRDLIERDLLPVRTIMRFVETGDPAVLLDDPRTEEALALARAVDTVPLSELQERIAAGLARAFSNRPVTRSDGSVASVFGTAPLRFVRSAIEEGRYEDAALASEVLALCSQHLGEMRYFDGSWLEEEPEPHDLRLSLALLSGAPIAGLLAECRLASSLGPFDLPKAGSPAFNVDKQAKAEKLPTPNEVLKAVLFTYRSDPRAATEIADRLAALAGTELPAEAPELEVRYPELAYARHAIMAHRLGATAPEEAEQHFRQALEYHRHGLPARLEERGFVPPGSSEARKEARRAAADRYAALGYPAAAEVIRRP
jgi:hypothetical protein